MSTCKVFKYPLRLKEFGIISLPVGAKLLHLGEQDGGLIVWALVDPSAWMEDRFFRIAGTGHPIAHDGRYVGTVQMLNGLVWHVFEVTLRAYEARGAHSETGGR